MGILTNWIKKLNFKFPKFPNLKEVVISNNIANAYIKDNTSKIEKKLKKGKKYYKQIKFIENFNYSLLHQSIVDRKQEVIDLVLKQTYSKDPDVIEDSDNDLGIAPLHLASLIDSVEILMELVNKADANVFIKTQKDGLSLLHFTAHNGNLKCFDFLFKKFFKNNINIMTNENWTPLHYACFMNRIDCASYLLDHKADMYAKNKQGLIPIELAILNDNFDLFVALYEHHYKEDELSQEATLTHIASSSKAGTKCLEYLLDNPNNINVISDSKLKASPLHFACMKNNLKAVKLLCIRGANVNMPDYLGNIPMMYATENGYIPILRVLHEYGSDAMKLNDEGLNAISIAMHQEQETNDVKLFFLGLEKYKNFENKII
jgi:ankyrin repeat protein